MKVVCFRMNLKEPTDRFVGSAIVNKMTIGSSSSIDLDQPLQLTVLDTSKLKN